MKTIGEDRRGSAVAVVVAGGSGLRMGGGVPKQYRLLCGVPVLVRTLMAFQEAGEVDGIIVVVPDSHRDGIFREFSRGHDLSKVLAVCPGGVTRQQSVGNALAVIGDDVDIIAVHDGVRPLVTNELIDHLLREGRRLSAVVPGVPVTDTVKRAGRDGRITSTLEREGLWLAQTPQVFRRAILQRAYEEAFRDCYDGTDDAALVERTGVSVVMVEGCRDNLKITREEDLLRAEALFELRRNAGAGEQES